MHAAFPPLLRSIPKSAILSCKTTACSEMLEAKRMMHPPCMHAAFPPLLRSIPKSAILSCKTTACSEMLEAERLGGGLGLTVAIMYERAIGKKSKW